MAMMRHASGYTDSSRSIGMVNANFTIAATSYSMHFLSTSSHWHQ